jgi:hypothetical protein
MAWSTYSTKGEFNTVTASQTAVLAVLKEHGPLPDHALVPIVQHVYGKHLSSSGIRTRRSELANARKIKPKGKVKMPSGRFATLWAAK